jgi:TonB family protein
MRTLISQLVIFGITLVAGQCQIPPQVVHLESPTYPEVARQARIQGSVRARIRVSAAGTVIGMEIDGGHQLLKEEVERNVAKWTFRVENESTVEVIYEFRLTPPELPYKPDVEVSFDLPSKVTIVSHAPVPIKDGTPIPQKR